MADTDCCNQVMCLILATRPNARIFRIHSKEKRTVKAVFRCFRTVSYAVGAE